LKYIDDVEMIAVNKQENAIFDQKRENDLKLNRLKLLTEDEIYTPTPQRTIMTTDNVTVEGIIKRPAPEVVDEEFDKGKTEEQKKFEKELATKPLTYKTW